MNESTSQILVVRYDPAWPIRFDELHARLWPHLRDLASALEHVGSTSVPGLVAKPVIDLDVIVRSPSAIGRCVDRLDALGYVYLGELGVPDRHAFKSPSGTFAHHLYVCLDGSASLRNHLLLREHLRLHPEEARAYGDLKRRLADLHPNDIEAYVDGKTEFILQILSSHGMSTREMAEVREVNMLPG